MKFFKLKIGELLYPLKQLGEKKLSFRPSKLELPQSIKGEQ